MIYTVYSIVCKENGKVYFGRSQEIEKRWRAHKNMLRRSIHNNTEMQKDWNLYSESNFEFNILEQSESLEFAIKTEQSYIDDIQYNKYNISDAKSGGDTFTNNPRKEEISKLKSINASGENNPMYGKPKTKYMIEKTREANSKPVRIEGETYSSLTEAGEKLNLGVTTVNYRLKSSSPRFIEWQYIS